MALEHENQRLLGDLLEVNAKKARQREELTQTVQQLEVVQKQTLGAPSSPKEAKMSLPTKFDGTRAQFQGFLNQVHLVLLMHPTQHPIDSA